MQSTDVADLHVMLTESAIVELVSTFWALFSASVLQCGVIVASLFVHSQSSLNRILRGALYPRVPLRFNQSRNDGDALRLSGRGVSLEASRAGAPARHAVLGEKASPRHFQRQKEETVTRPCRLCGPPSDWPNALSTSRSSDAAALANPAPWQCTC